MSLLPFANTPGSAGGGDMILAATQTNTGPKTFNAGTLLDKGEIVYDVIAFGAVGDGTTDDSAAIQSAISAIESAGGGNLYLPTGTYLLGTTLTITLDKGFKMTGNGFTSILKIDNATDIYAITFSPTASGIWAIFRDFKIECNGANQSSAGGGVYAAGAIECLFDSVWFNEPFDYGLYLYQISMGEFGHHNKVTNCLFDQGISSSGSGVGIFFQSNDENRIHDCEFQFMGGASPAIAPAAIVDNTGLNTITNSIFVSGLEGIRFQDASRGQVANCTFDSVEETNIYLKGTELLVVGNQFYQPQTGASSNTYDVVRVDFYGLNNVSNNFFRSNTSNGLTRSFIHDDGSGSNIYTSNQFEVQGTMGTSLVDIVSVGNTIEVNSLSLPLITSKSSNYTLTETDFTVLATGNTTITLPTAVGRIGRQYTVKKNDASNTTVLNTTSAETIDGSTSISITVQYISITVISNGSNWSIV